MLWLQYQKYPCTILPCCSEFGGSKVNRLDFRAYYSNNGTLKIIVFCYCCSSNVNRHQCVTVKIKLLVMRLHQSRGRFFAPFEKCVMCCGADFCNIGISFFINKK